MLLSGGYRVRDSQPMRQTRPESRQQQQNAAKLTETGKRQRDRQLHTAELQHWHLVWRNCTAPLKKKKKSRKLSTDCLKGKGERVQRRQRYHLPVWCSDSKSHWHWTHQARLEATTCHLMPINTLRDSDRARAHSMMRNHISVHRKRRRRRRKGENAREEREKTNE